MGSSFGDIDHLLRRAGFGGHAPEIGALMALDWADAVEAVLDTSAAVDSTVGVPNLSPSRSWSERYIDMTRFWVDRAATTSTPLVEKMVLFWHGHLCSSLDKVYDHRLMFDQNQLFRTNGLGNFATLLHAVADQPAMMIYLDNDRNEAADPNENFARELMELFTVGVGNYSEDDVRESARAWAGYGVTDIDLNEPTKIVTEIHAQHLDLGQKTFMGVTKAWTGPETIDHLLWGPPQATTARFIAAKVWSFFAYPEPPDGAALDEWNAVVNDLGVVFAGGSMEMTALLRAVFNRPEFRGQYARQGLVRSPFDFVVAGMRRTGMPSSVAHPEWRLPGMGQAAFRPPNVAGWGANQYWISPSAAWEKRDFASGLRWAGLDAGLLADSEDLSPVDAVQNALLLFGLYNAGPATRLGLQAFVEAERAANGWGERSGLLLLSMLTPEFQLA